MSACVQQIGCTLGLPRNCCLQPKPSDEPHPQTNTPTGNVVLIDLDCKFDPLRIVQIINARAQPGGRPPDLEIAMGRFHMARCHSSAQFLALLATLPLRLQQMQVRSGRVDCLITTSCVCLLDGYCCRRCCC